MLWISLDYIQSFTTFHSVTVKQHRRSLTGFPTKINSVKGALLLKTSLLLYFRGLFLLVILKINILKK